MASTMHPHVRSNVAAARLTALDQLQEEMEGEDAPTGQSHTQHQQQMAAAYHHRPPAPVHYQKQRPPGNGTGGVVGRVASGPGRLQGVYQTGSAPQSSMNPGGRPNFFLIQGGQGVSMGMQGSVPAQLPAAPRSTTTTVLLAGKPTAKPGGRMNEGNETFDGTLAQMPLPLPGYSIHIAAMPAPVDLTPVVEAMNEGSRAVTTRGVGEMREIAVAS